MKILALRTLEGRNLWSHRPVVQARLLMEGAERFSTGELPGLAGRLLKLLPGLWKHHCARGYPGGFCERLAGGTYLGHVVEHVALELQARAGFPKSFGKTVSGPVPDSWEVVIEYGTPQLGRACLEAAVALTEAVAAGRDFPVAETLAALMKLGRETRPGPSSESILSACRRRGIPVMTLAGGTLMQLGYGCRRKLIQATLTSEAPALAVDLVGDKLLTKRLLGDAGIPVPRGRVVFSLEQAKEAAADLGYPVVVKPCHGNQGQGVSLNLENPRQLAAAYRIARNYDREVLVEEYVPGRHYRLLVIGGRLVAAAERLPACLTGDGVHTLRELLEMANRDSRRGEGHEKPLTALRFDPVSLLELARQGYTPESRPPLGEVVILRSNANLSSGGTARDVTALVAPENACLAEQAARLTGLDVAGIDLVAPDISLPVSKQGGALIEVNAAPGFRMHLYPQEGEPRQVGEALVEHLFPPGAPVSIPVISITGTNGKTTTARMLAHLFRQQGLRVGLTTTGGIYIDGICICTGDTTGPDSARVVLQDPAVELAVLETARGGIIRGGLGYDLADVAVVTNVGPDHLGQEGVETLEDLFWVKSLVVEAVRKGGYVVLNGDDPFASKLAGRARGEVVYFSLEENNLLVRRHLGTGGCALFTCRGSIYIGRGEDSVRLMGLKGIKAGMGGRARHNLENALAAAAAAYVAGLPIALIRRGLRTFGSAPGDNPGRLTLFRLGRVTVVVDYGHNAPAFKMVARYARSLHPRRLIGVVGVPGDRGDHQIEAAGEVAGLCFDELYIKEDRDLRGRAPGETAGLLYRGACRTGKPPALLHTISDEVEALKAAVAQASAGDVVVVFYEKLEEIMAFLESEAARLCAGKERQVVMAGN